MRLKHCMIFSDVRISHGRESTFCRLSSELCVHNDGSSQSGLCLTCQLSLTLGTLNFKLKVESSTDYLAKFPIPSCG